MGVFKFSRAINYKYFVMLQLKKRIALAASLICLVITFSSCNTEENLHMEENQVISNTNFELLKSRALNTFQGKDFSYLLKPSITKTKVNYQGILDQFNKPQNRNIVLPITNFREYQSELKGILGENYHDEYFTQLFELYRYSETIIKSELFSETSTLEERREYLQETLEFVFQNNIETPLASRTGECEEYRDNCYNQAESTLGNTIAGCTVSAIFAGIFSGGPGAAIWVPCTIAAGYAYDGQISGCDANYTTCTTYN